MQQYSIYAVSADGRIYMRVDLYSSSDDEAKKRAQQLASQYDGVELWEGSRKIGEFKGSEGHH
ncbi:hypothetical protein [Bradyrhizobium neotropicale]|uniref:hypothetical protein n=1 Tax=Bradyrhizobium neotropicale TaxID=1497615 RepID=UPI001AD651E0|nr:hypothetical protein [Bradyrhizobium neotropicale]MBO4227572.1 hypothetical protein [Bradyrhizobium neotropicale]